MGILWVLEWTPRTNGQVRETAVPMKKSWSLGHSICQTQPGDKNVVVRLLLFSQQEDISKITWQKFQTQTHGYVLNLNQRYNLCNCMDTHTVTLCVFNMPRVTPHRHWTIAGLVLSNVKQDSSDGKSGNLVVWPKPWSFSVVLGGYTTHLYWDYNQPS